MWSWSSSNPPKSYLKVYAGTSYDKSSLVPVPVNQSENDNNKNSSQTDSSKNDYRPKLLNLESNLIEAKVVVCVQNFQQPVATADNNKKEDGSNSEELKSTTSPYFSNPLHIKDKLSIQLSVAFKPNKNGTEQQQYIYGDDLLWGNDFDKPIRDQLPYGSGLGVQILQKTIDPSVEGDIYADTPYLYGAALTSFNKVATGKVNAGNENENKAESEKEGSVNSIVWPGILEKDDLSSEDPTDSSSESSESSDSSKSPKDPDSTSASKKKALAIPKDSSARSKYFLDKSNRHNFKFQMLPTQYSFDFYTPYLDLGNEFAINLPGFKLNVEKYGNNQPLRYTLKNKRTQEVYLVVVFELIKIDEQN